MQSVIERQPDVITSKQLRVAGLVLILFLLCIFHFRIIPPVIKFLVGTELAAKYQSWYLSDTTNPNHQALMGYRFSTGRGLIKSKNQAFYWWQKAAAQGNSRAQYNLAWHFIVTKGKYRDYKRGNDWLFLAFKQDNPSAYSLIAWCYARGTCKEKSTIKASHHFLNAARLGDKYAHSYLGYYYLNGLGGLRVSHKKARFHYEIAAKNGIKGAKKKLASMSRSKANK